MAETSSWTNVVTAILQQMDAEGFEFGQYDSNDDGMIDAINIFYWGIGTISYNYAYI